MRTVRICQLKAPLAIDAELPLDDDGYGHLIRVLRFTEDDEFVVFDGLGNEYEAILTAAGKSATYKCTKKIERNVESPLFIELGQVISRGDKMEFTIQKAVELGISKITPLYSSRCGVKLDDKRKDKKVEQWQKIAIAACEQSGRNVVPVVENITNIDSWYSQSPEYLSLTLDPKASIKLTELEIKKNIRLLIGPEGGLDDQEIQKSKDNSFIGVTLGPRILRTETAALAALSILGCKYGDL
ncbi:MAG: 16S rRNA (uracil(1498)-N(3))-methyltransferase [Aeromonadales bacterium]|nr:16S rRNA (uracil(1498)-N(3))-methyltransferase [Aeromonadales bacterium]